MNSNPVPIPVATSEKLELGLLVLLVFFLPLRETPKTLCVLLYLGFWLFNRWKRKSWGDNDLFFDLPLILIIFLAIVSSIFSPFDQAKSFDKSLDFSFAAILAICIRRAAYQFNLSLRILLIAMGFGVSLALAEGIFKGNAFPFLKSVGHVNQVANYLVISFAISFSVLFSTENLIKHRLLWLFSVIFLTAGFATESRNAALATGIIILATILLIPRKKLFNKEIVLRGGLLGIIVTILLFSSDIFEKQLSHLSRGSIDTERVKLWKTALISADDQLLLGYGPGMFEAATSRSNIEKLVAKNNIDFRPDEFFHSSHGHNLFIHWLVERGLFSLFVLLFWIAYLFRISFFSLRFLNRFKSGEAEQEDPISASIASQVLFSICIAVLAVGIGNTSLRVEHGLLAMLFIGLAYSGAKYKLKIK